jgi:hypothetical protein
MADADDRTPTTPPARTRPPQADADEAATPTPPGAIDPRPEGGPGASDGYSGGGPGGGLLDAESAMRLPDDLADKGDPDEDRNRLFPDQGNRAAGADDDDKGR